MQFRKFTKDNIQFYSAETDEIKICVCPEKGGELSSVEYLKLLPGRELLFKGADYSPVDCGFKGRAPWMWPMVTRNYIKEVETGPEREKNPQLCSYRYNNRVYYTLPSAFAKDLPWKFAGIDGDGKISCKLESSAATREQYPFEFEITAAYGIDGSRIVMEYQVENRGKNEMFFSSGNHIGINIPFNSGTDIRDLRLSASGDRKRLTNRYTTFTEEYQELPLNAGIPFTHECNVFSMVSAGYGYDDNYFRISDNNIFFEISHRVNAAESSGLELPESSELYYTTFGCPEKGFICTEPWIGGINSFNTGQGLIFLKPGGIFKWKIIFKWGQVK